MSQMPGTDAGDGSVMMSQMPDADAGPNTQQQGADNGAAGNQGRRERRQTAAPAGRFVAKLVPHRDMAPHRLTPRYLDLETSPSMPDMPKALTVQPAKGDAEIPHYLRGYRSVFEDAAAQSDKLQRQILSDSRARAIELADTLAASRRRVQKSLDDGLGDLDRNYDREQITIEQGERTAIYRLTQIASTARAMVKQAAQQALGTVAARKRVIEGRMSTSQGEALAIENTLAGYSNQVEQKGSDATAAFTDLAAKPGSILKKEDAEKAVPGSGDYCPELISAIREPLDPAVIHHSNERSTAYSDAKTIFSSNLATAHQNFQTSATNAFQPFQSYVDMLGTTAPAKIVELRNNSTKAIRRMEKQCRRTIAESRNKAQISLAERHAKVRGASIERAQKMADGQAAAIERAGGGQIHGYSALAAGQSSTVSALHDNIAEQSKLPGEQFANYVTTAASQTKDQGAKSTRGKRTEMDERARQMRSSIFDRVKMSANSYDDNIAKFVDQFRQASAQSSSAMLKIALAQQKAMRSLAKPVRDSVNSFKIPAEDALERMENELRKKLQTAGLQAQSAYDGSEAPPSDQPAVNQSQQPAAQERPQLPARVGRVPQQFVKKSVEYTAKPETEKLIARIIGHIGGTVGSDVARRSGRLKPQMSKLGQNPKETLDLLRGLTALRGQAVSKYYQADYGRNLRDDIWWYMNIGNAFSGMDTRRYSRQAAIDYLDGNRARGALNEVRAATEWYNDGDQAIDALTALDPADMAALRGLPGAEEILAEVSEDLGGTDQQAFDILRNATAENAQDALASARAIRLTPVIREKLAISPERGADQAFDAIQKVSRQVGTTRLESANEFGLDANFEFETAAARQQSRREAWGNTVARLGNDGRARTGGAAAGTQWLDNQVSQQRVYVDNYIVFSHVYTGSARPEQRRLLHNIAEFGADAPETRGAQLAAEDTREGGAKRDRFENALDFGSGGPAAVDENGNILTPQQRAERQRALDDETQQPGNALPSEEDRMLQFYDRYRNGGDPSSPRSSEAIRRDLGRSVRQGSDDERLGRVLELQATKGLRHPDTVALAFEHAVNTWPWGTDEQMLRDTFGRMNRDQIDAAVTKYDSTHSESLYSRLGFFEHEDTWWNELSGDDRLDIEVLAMGQPRNARERAEVSRMRSRQQRRNSSTIGRWLAGEEYGHMERSHNRLINAMGIKNEDAAFDARGRLRAPNGQPVGNFGKDGNFEAAGPMGSIAFGMAVTANQEDAQGYRIATDNIAAAVAATILAATAIIATIAAVVLTIASAGAAAIILIPAAITLVGGVGAMFANKAIKGGRYGYEDAGRDFGLALVQAATAGIASGLGAAAAGAAGGAQAAATGLRAGAKVLAGEVMVGAVAGGVGGAGNALFDDEAWDKGEWFENIGRGFERGVGSGAVGALVTGGITRGVGVGANRLGRAAGMRTALARGRVGETASRYARMRGAAAENSMATNMIGRVLGGGASGAASRAYEIDYDRSRGRYRGSSAQAWGEITDAGVQNAIQSFGEGVGENAVQNSAWARRHLAHQKAEARARDSGVDEDDHLIARPTADEDGDFTGATRRGSLTDEDGPAGSRLRSGADDADGEVIVRTIDDDPDKTNPNIKLDDIEAASRAAQGNEDAMKAARKSPRRMDDPAEGDFHHLRPVRDQRDLTYDDFIKLGSMPKDSRITASDPHSEAAAMHNYDMMRRQDVNREVLLIQNDDTGKFMVVQGDSGAVTFPAGKWTLERHSHPRIISGELEAIIGRSLPSGGESGTREGDLRVLMVEVDRLASAAPEGAVVSRRSVIDIDVDGRRFETTFGITRGPGGDEITVTFHHPRDGETTIGPFRSIEAYEIAAAGPALSNNPNFTKHHGPSGSGGVGTVRSPPRPVHGDAAPARQAGDIDFVRQRMAAAGDFEAQVAGLRGGDGDMHPGRAVALEEAHQRVRDMGLVGESDSMIRLHNIINDDTIPMATRRLISDVTLEAARQHMLRSGQLESGEPLIMLFHGATDSRARSIVEGGIDMSRRPGGIMDDFGQGLYFTQHLESAMVYSRSGRGATRGDANGTAIPYVLRGRDFGSAVDVSTGGPHRAQWEAFVTANQELFQTLRVDPEFMRRPDTMAALLRGEPLPFGRFDAEGRGAVFDAFLAHMGGAHGQPDIIFGDLGGPLTSGVQFRGGLTDQAAIRSPRIADILNEQHAPRRALADNDNDTGPVTVRSGDGPDDTLGSGGEHTLKADSTSVRDADTPVAVVDPQPEGKPKAAVEQLFDGEVGLAGNRTQMREMEQSLARTLAHYEEGSLLLTHMKDIDDPVIRQRLLQEFGSIEHAALHLSLFHELRWLKNQMVKTRRDHTAARVDDAQALQRDQSHLDAVRRMLEHSGFGEELFALLRLPADAPQQDAAAALLLLQQQMALSQELPAARSATDITAADEMPDSLQQIGFALRDQGGGADRFGDRRRLPIYSEFDGVEMFPAFRQGIDSNDGQEVCDFLRQLYNIPEERNLAIAEIEIGGSTQLLISRSSKTRVPEGMAQLPESPRFRVHEDAAMPNDHHTEPIILETLASRLQPEQEGLLVLYTERDACDSCRHVFDQFHAAFPNVTIIVTWRGGASVRYPPGS